MKYIHFSATGNSTFGNNGSVLWTVTVNTAASSAVLTIYDGTSASDPVVAAIDCATIRSLCYGVTFTTGLYAVLSGGNADVTIGVA